MVWMMTCPLNIFRCLITSFTSYALGSAYGVQILRTMEKDFDVFACAAKGDLLPIRDWLKSHVFSIVLFPISDNQG